MDPNSHGEATGINPVAATLDLLGDRLTLALLGHSLVDGTSRFNQWLELTGAPPAVLADRLNTLVAAGVLRRSPQLTIPDRYEYLLTELGTAAWQILMGIWGWQREWTPEGAWQPNLVHTTCGHRGPAVVMCRECGATVTGHDTDVEMNAAAVWTVTSGARRRSTRRPARDAPRGDMQFNAIMAAFGDRWSGAITGLALSGTRRFSEFRSALDISPTTLTDRLTRLCDADILHRPTGTDREYRLTPRGRALFSVFVFLIQWATQAYPHTEAPLRIRHRSCGAVLTPVLRCRGCDEPVDRASARIESIAGQP